jgi:hypothetical protein
MTTTGGDTPPLPAAMAPGGDQHAQYTATATAYWDRAGRLQLGGRLVVQCPTTDHEHTARVAVHSVVIDGPAGETAWMVRATGPNAVTAGDQAMTVAKALGFMMNPNLGPKDGADMARPVDPYRRPQQS